MVAPPVDINWIAVIAATVVSMVIGYVWYSPMLFSKQWMAGIGKTEKDMKEMQKKRMSTQMVVAIVGALVFSIIMSVFVDYAGATDAVSGALVGIMAWLGFIATTTMAMSAFEGRSQTYWLIVNGHHFLAFAFVGAILAAWA